MRFPPLALLVPVLLLAARGARGEEEASPDVQRLRAEAEVLARIGPAVDRGVAWLEACQRANGAFRAWPPKPQSSKAASHHLFGKTALATLTLAHCGRDLEDEHVRKAVRYLRRSHATVLSGNGMRHASTYSMALFLMAIFELHRTGAAPVENDGAHDSAFGPLDLPPWARTRVRATVRWFLRTREEAGLFSYPAVVRTPPKGVRPGRPPGRRGADISNTQYALLGLWAGARCGERVPAATLTSLAEALLGAQAQDGEVVRRRTDRSTIRGPSLRDPPPTDRVRGFGYVAHQEGTAIAASASMTAGGLSSLLVVKSMLLEGGDLDKRLRTRLDQAIWDAIAWLTLHYDVAKNTIAVDRTSLPPEVRDRLPANLGPSAGIYHGYYLYGLERALVIAGKRYLGDHDWYREGARLLLDTQHADGSWRDGTTTPSAPGRAVPRSYHDPLADTCFALLFLRRATLRPRSNLLGAPAEGD